MNSLTRSVLTLASYDETIADQELHTPVSYTHLDVYKRQGANWGDEGKGKITDMLAKEADILSLIHI